MPITGTGFAAGPGNPVISTSELQLTLGELKAVYNDESFLSYENANTNMDAEETASINEKAGEVFRLSGKLPRKAPARVPFRKSDLGERLDMPYNSNVEHPDTYAQAALNSRLIKSISGGISNLLSDTPAKTQKIIDILGDIEDIEKASDTLFFPDYCMAKREGSHWDKALLAFGLFDQLTGSTDNTYIALGENSSYLVFKKEDHWKYLDCRYNTIRDYIEFDDIYAVFNKDSAYNEKIGIGDPPDFIK